MTITLTATAVLQLKKQELTLLQKIDALTAKMQSSPYFSLELKEKIQKWMREFPECQDSLEAISFALCKLVCGVIYKAIILQDDEKVKEELLCFEDAVIDLLKEAIRPDETPEDFIEMYRTLSEIERSQLLLNQAATNAQNELRQMYQASVKDLQELNILKQDMSVAAVEKATLLQKKLHELQNKNLCHATEMCALGRQLQQSQKDQDALVKEGTRILD